MSPNEKISELVTRDPITVTIDAPIPTAAAEMADNQIGDILVQDEGVSWSGSSQTVTSRSSPRSTPI